MALTLALPLPLTAITVIHHHVRCPQCGKKLAEYCAAPFLYTCPRCKAAVSSAQFPAAG